MFKRFLALLMTILLLPLSARAAGWELNGALLNLVATSGEWEQYVTLCPQVGNVAALRGPDHNVLIMEENEGLKTFTGALFQPGDSYEGRPLLSATQEMLLIHYHESLWVTFYRHASGHYLLSEAMFDDLSVELSADETYYTFTDQTGQSVIMRRHVWLEEFNIELFPKTLDEVRHLNWMLASLDSGEHILGGSDVLMSFSRGLSKASVFTAPYVEDALRAANGHATVSFNGDVWMLREWRNEYGGDYYCIRYDVHPGLQRIGFIRRNHIDGPGAEPWPESETLNARVVALRSTVLTDDPDVSQTPVLRIAKGARLRCLGTYDDTFAYVSTADNLGRTVWGFVPMRDLTMLSSVLYEPETEVMAQLEGVWMFESGNGKLADLLTLRSDGTYEGFLFFTPTPAPGQLTCIGSWYVTKYDPAARLYQNDPVYEITFIDGDGTVIVDGLSFTEENLLTYGLRNTNVYRKMNLTQ